MKKLIVLAFGAIAMSAAFYACQKETKSNSLNGSSEEIATKKPGGGGGGGSSSTLDPLTLTCIGEVSGASIDVTVCAGASGASAGFSVQWETKADYDLYGWSSANAPSYCGASFSGVPGCKGSNKYSLGTNGCVTVNIGDNLFDDCGASASCGTTVLQCGTEYIFRAFAHNVPGGLNASDKSGTTSCTTKACGGEGCTYTQGYWKTHGTDLCRTGNNTNNWPADVLANGLTLGNVVYTADQLCTILNTPAGGTNLALAHQLISALLNIANGSSGAPQSCIDDANAWLAAHGGVNGKQINSVLTDCLTDYNEGATGPGHCSSN
jgi:hypothetical protein